MSTAGAPTVTEAEKPSCLTCEHLLYHTNECRNCLGTREEVTANGGRDLYRNYKKGDALKKRRAAERGGLINIVIGGQGEHEVNALWPIDEAYRRLSRTCENVGGMVGRDGLVLVLSKPDLSGSYELEYWPATSDIRTILHEIRVRRTWTFWSRD